MALIHHGDWRKLPKHLDQGCIWGICQQDFPVLKFLRKPQQIAVFLVNLPDILLCAVDSKGGIAKHADSQHLPDGIRGEILAVQQHFLGIYPHTASKVPVQPLAVWMAGI